MSGVPEVHIDENIRLEWNEMFMSNTLAYYSKFYIAAGKV
jgi:hypothetical protein